MSENGGMERAALNEMEGVEAESGQHSEGAGPSYARLLRAQREYWQERRGSLRVLHSTTWHMAQAEMQRGVGVGKPWDKGLERVGNSGASNNRLIVIVPIDPTK
jgi:hypothetical protein